VRVLVSCPACFAARFYCPVSMRQEGISMFASKADAFCATQQAEISFCSYNGGGWRKVVGHMNRTATLAEWYRSHLRHKIYAKGKNVDLAQPIGGKVETSLVQIEAAPVPPSIAVL
jgi:hypothetical protein